MTTHFNYHLNGYGWAEAFFCNEKQNVRFDVSYLSDPVSDLFCGLLKLINNQSDFETTEFYDEPTKNSLIITRHNPDAVTIEIYWSDSWEESGTASKRLIYSDVDTLSNFTLTVCKGIESLLERNTAEEYKQEWVAHEFPMESFNQLREAIKYM